LFPDSDGRALNYTKLNGIDDWMIFLGYGWKLANHFLIPDASTRLESLLDSLLPSAREVAVGRFIASLSSKCPELDRGVLFERCRQAVYDRQSDGNHLSLMLSTALRTLQTKKRIKMINSPDARDNWELFPDVSDPFSRITHISRVMEKA
jgi:hypothetical protein